MNSRYKGIFFITLSALSFAFMNAFVRLSGDLPSVQKSFFRNMVAFFIALVMILRSRDGFKIEKGNLKYMILRATFGTVGILCNFYAVDHLVLADASILNKMSPFFTVLFSWLILKEKVMPIQLSLIFGAFLGSIFVSATGAGTCGYRSIYRKFVRNQADIYEYGTGTIPDRTVRRNLCRYRLCDGAYPGTERAERFFGSDLLLWILLRGYIAISDPGFSSDERITDSDASWCGTCSCGWSVRNHGGLLSCTCERDIHL